jgi:type II secretory pathway pseudopilin PulG
MQSRERERGGALLVAVVVVVIVVGLGGAFLTESVFRSRQAMIESQADEAQRLIDASLDHSRRMLFVYKSQNLWSFDQILQYNQTLSTDPLAHRASALAELRKKMKGETSDCLNGSTNESDWVPPSNKTTYSSTDASPFGRFIYYNRGLWHVVVRNNHDDSDPYDPSASASTNLYKDPSRNALVDGDNILKLFITATMYDGVQRSFEALVFYRNPNMIVNGAVLTGGTIKLHGSGRVNITSTGVAPQANVLSNANIIVQGNVDVNGDVKAHGTVTTIGDPTIRGDMLEAQPRFPLTQKLPSELLTDPFIVSNGYIHLKRDGSVVVFGVPQVQPGKYGNFEYKRATSQWTLGGNGPLPTVSPKKNIFFIEGDLDVSGHPEINATLLVEGSVDMTGAPTTQSLPDMIADWQNLAIYAGGDVRLSGTVSVNGVVVAREQVSMSGNVTVTGSVVAVDIADTHSLVTTRSNLNDEFSGSVSVMFPGPMEIPLPLDLDTLELLWVRKRP